MCDLSRTEELFHGYQPPIHQLHLLSPSALFIVPPPFDLVVDVMEKLELHLSVRGFERKVR
jgi:hypothetical protein